MMMIMYDDEGWTNNDYPVCRTLCAKVWGRKGLWTGPAEKGGELLRLCVRVL
jgi:hypothetical protein